MDKYITDIKLVYALDVINNESSPFKDKDLDTLLHLGTYTLRTLSLDYALFDELTRPRDEMFEYLEISEQFGTDESEGGESGV